MRTVTAVRELRAALAPALRRGEAIGLAPTMGALHEGHRSLVRRCVAENALSVVSVFVNPLQFGAGEDLAAYPRDQDRDAALLAAEGVDVLFAPRAATFTPPERRTTVRVAGLGDRLEGASRPGHFDGVATIVTKLLSAVRATRAYFGEKDFQQLAVLRAVVRDLDLGVELVACSTVRDPDGLALSSRNAYLSAAERQDALALSRALRAAAAAWDGDADAARAALRSTLASARGVRLDYAEVVDPETLDPLEGVVKEPAQALVAAFVGRTRLIDALRLDRRGTA